MPLKRHWDVVGNFKLYKCKERPINLNLNAPPLFANVVTTELPELHFLICLIKIIIPSSQQDHWAAMNYDNVCTASNKCLT